MYTSPARKPERTIIIQGIEFPDPSELNQWRRWMKWTDDVYKRWLAKKEGKEWPRH